MADDFSFPSSLPEPAAHGDAAAMGRQAIAELSLEISKFTAAIDRLRDLVKALALASKGEVDGDAPALYWPHLVETLEQMIPDDDALDQAVLAAVVRLEH